MVVERILKRADKRNIAKATLTKNGGEKRSMSPVKCPALATWRGENNSNRKSGRTHL